MVFSRKALAGIIGARVSEIFELALQEFKKVSLRGALAGGVVLTGGGAALPKIIELAKKEMKLPVRLGFPAGIEGLDKDPALSTAAGLILEGADLESSGITIPVLDGGLFKKIKKALTFFAP